MLSNVCQHEYLHSVVIDNFPIKIDIFDMQLAAYPDRPKVEFIVNGLRTGFHGFSRCYYWSKQTWNWNKKLILNTQKHDTKP
jgi:hypothetical protein